MFTHSIRWRLQAWVAFLLVCVLSGFGITVYQLQRLNQFNQLDEELERRVAALNTAVRGGPPPEFGPGRPPFGGRPEHSDGDDELARPVPPRGRPEFPPPGRPREMRFGPRATRFSPELLSLFDETQTNGFYFAAWTRDGSLLKRSTNAPPDLTLPERPGRDARTHTRMRDSFREAYYFTGLGDCVLAGRSITADLDAMRRFAWWLLAAGGAVLALGLGGGWRLTTRAIRPIEEISAAASRISAGNLSERIRGPGANNELGRLAGVLNSTFGRLEAAFSQRSRANGARRNTAKPSRPAWIPPSKCGGSPNHCSNSPAWMPARNTSKAVPRISRRSRASAWREFVLWPPRAASRSIATSRLQRSQETPINLLKS
ncbi:MAG: integral membrane sensor signal transduction histidine kinase [Alphaproteobacteria bacterium]|nr:MAG: integral membrane sensor signal transduction histidine kinase [Alphaproteobacteria bacterium]